MTQWLRQNTAATVLLGPFIESASGAAFKSGLSIASGNVILSKNAGTFGTKTETASCTDRGNGYYSCPLGSGDVNTLGNLTLAVTGAAITSGTLPFFQDYVVLSQNSYDAMISGSATLPIASVAGAVGSVTNGVIVSGYNTGQSPAEQVTGYAIPSNITDATTVISGQISSLNNLSSGDVANSIFEYIFYPGDGDLPFKEITKQSYEQANNTNVKIYDVTNTLSSGLVDSADIKEAVWNAKTSGYIASGMIGTFGHDVELTRMILTNHQIDNGTTITIHDDDDNAIGSWTWTAVTGDRSKLTGG